MKRLWAPWRLAYVTRETPAEDDGCFLCTAPKRQDDAVTLIVARAEHCFAILNRYPYNPGHLMIAPYQHVPTIEELDAPTLTDIMLLAQRCLAALRAAMRPDGFNMGINQGKVAGAGVTDHVHYHIVPRGNGDTNYMQVLGDVKVMPDLLENTYQQLRTALETLTRPTG